MSRVRAGFSLVELLVVVAIIALALAIALPAVQYARESSRRGQCGSNQRQFGIAFINHETSRKAFPSSFSFEVGAGSSSPSVALRNFAADLLPYLDEGAIDAQYNRDTTFCDARNALAITAEIGVAICPSAPKRKLLPVKNFIPSRLFPEIAKQDSVLGPLLDSVDATHAASYSGAPTDYSIPVEQDSMFPSPTEDLTINDVQAYVSALRRTGKADFSLPIQAADIEDGLSHTLMLTEDGGRPQRWQNGRRASRVDSLTSAWAAPDIGLDMSGGTGSCFPQCDNNGRIYSFHDTGVNVLFADGHVEFVTADIDSVVISKLVTVNGRDN